MGTVESKIKQVRLTIQALNQRVDSLIEGVEVIAMTQVSERSLSQFLSREPDLYSEKDLKVKYR